MQSFSVITGISYCDEGSEHIPNRQLQPIHLSIEIGIALCLPFTLQLLAGFPSAILTYFDHTEP